MTISCADPDPVLEALRRRDELLSMLYWLCADGISQAPQQDELIPFMSATELLATDLHELTAAGLVETIGDADERRYRLTAAGYIEGKRRFDEDFIAPRADGTAGNAHEVIVGVCGPNAKCMKDGTHGECAEPAIELPKGTR